MSIDEAIAFCHEKSNNIKLKAEPQVFIQLAEWLEELKFLRQWKSDVMDEFCKYDCNSVEEARHNAYNKAVDDFERIMCEELKDYIDHKDYMCVGLNLHKFTRDLAEQLKECGLE